MNRPTPGAPQPLLVQAFALLQQGQWVAAQALFQQVLSVEPGNFDALHLGGVATAKAGNLQRAAEMLGQAVAAAPHHAMVNNSLGMVQQALGDRTAALSSYGRACELDPACAEALGHRGALLLELGRTQDALRDLDRALAAGGSGAALHFNRGLALQLSGDAAAAMHSYAKTISLKPDHAAAHNNRGTLQQQQGQFDAALQSYGRAIGLQPDYAEAYKNRATTLCELKRFEAALDDYDKALALRPDYELLHGQRLHARMQVCDWRGFDERRSELLQRIAAGALCTPPFALLAIADEPRLQRQAAEIYSRRRHPPSTPALAAHPPGPRIRLGYFSADLHDHATAQLMAGLFEQHDRKRFELFAFSFGPAEQDAMRRRLSTCFEHFIDVREQSVQDIAALARRLSIDIAIDLKGYTKDGRPGIFAARAAPLQVSYLGYPGTLGAPYIDYLFADRVLIPPGAEAHYAEQIVCLPGSYQANDAAREIAPETPTRGQLGLPAQGVVFCCFNASYKITPAQFDIWLRILQQVPGSVMWLLEGPGRAAGNLRDEARRRGVDPARLHFAPHLPPAEHLARQRVADLFLDTLPYNAHTTASDALWVGLPVVTCCGDSFAGRVAASLLQALELPELIASSSAAYEQRAVALALDAQQLARLRERLALQRRRASLFDTQRFTRNIERAYTLIHQRKLAGLPAACMDLGEATAFHSISSAVDK